MLARAARPIIVMGDGIAFAEAQDELTRVAEVLGAEVWGGDAGEVNMPASHPLSRGLLGHMFGDHSRGILHDADAALVSGTYLLPEVFPRVDEVFAPSCEVVHIDLDAYEIAKNHPVTLGMVADPKLGLAALARELEATMTADQKRAAAQRLARSRDDRRQQDEQEKQRDLQAAGQVPMGPALFMRELAARLPDDAIIWDEALTTSPDVARYLPADRPGSYFLTRGGSLGVGLPGGIGAKIANPDRTVVAFAGDGGSMYTIQALWSAAHHRVATKFVNCNNRSYRLLKINLQQYWVDSKVPQGDFPWSFDINDPDIDFTRLAEGLGVPAVRIDHPSQVTAGIERALAHDGPFLIELVIDGAVAGEPVHIRCGQ
jgi:benzoylformate decarboxylase